MKTPIGLTGNPIWKRNIQHGDLWLKAHLTIPISENVPNYRIVFEAILGSGYKGDVAIDEIVFQPNKKCSPVSEFANAVTHYCDFETNDACNYKNENSDVDWIRTQATSGDPNVDNTYQTSQGHYMKLKVII